MSDCKLCVHKPVCDLWRSQECQDAGCFSGSEDGCDFFLEGWIPVKDSLPKCGERVLATDGGFVGEFYINKRGQWQRYNVNNYSLLMELDILWWMPLPEPPKEDAT